MPSPLTKKIGPLPVWGWAVAIGGTGFAVKMLSGGSKTPQKQIVQTEYDDSFGPTVGFQEGLSRQLFDVQQEIDDIQNILAGQTTTPAPGGGKRTDDGSQLPGAVTNPVAFTWPIANTLTDWFIQMRKLYPTWYQQYLNSGGRTQSPGETEAARLSRLLAERDFYADMVSAKPLPTGTSNPLGTPTTWPGMPTN